MGTGCSNRSGRDDSRNKIGQSIECYSRWTVGQTGWRSDRAWRWWHGLCWPGSGHGWLEITEFTDPESRSKGIWTEKPGNNGSGKRSDLYVQRNDRKRKCSVRSGSTVWVHLWRRMEWPDGQRKSRPDIHRHQRKVDRNLCRGRRQWKGRVRLYKRRRKWVECNLQLLSRWNPGRHHWEWQLHSQRNIR